MKFFTAPLLAIAVFPASVFAQDFSVVSRQEVAYRIDSFTSAPPSTRRPSEELRTVSSVRKTVRADVGIKKSSLVRHSDRCERQYAASVAELCLLNGWKAEEREPRSTFAGTQNYIIGNFSSSESIDGVSPTLLVVRDERGVSGLRSAYSQRISESMKQTPGYRKVTVLRANIAGYHSPLHVFDARIDGKRERVYHMAVIHNGLAYGVLGRMPATASREAHNQMLEIIRSIQFKKRSE